MDSENVAHPVDALRTELNDDPNKDKDQDTDLVTPFEVHSISDTGVDYDKLIGMFIIASSGAFVSYFIIRHDYLSCYQSNLLNY